ncbi:1-hydroxycarotenoid 3,4-desaturase CrtD [Parasphingopyxis algicola]|uniref:1-hydroxycarotenoid 3,4-desaturase CrtD n=1 Tax=Parasphingopyxis algicola TaxID=2026624 RepID=UPI001FE3538F|nr:1-hydroxycarotenoid 3,4-desaturase CrtD [Parasphingopyxis algicola]
MPDGRIAIIGAGIGGLVSAALLAARGQAVTVIEKEQTPGGKVRRVNVDGAEIDGGPTVFTLRDVFDEIFDSAGASLDDHVTMRRADILARHAWGPDERLDLFADPVQSEAAIGEFAGARAARGFRTFSAEARRIYDLLDASFLRASKTWPPGLMQRIGLWRIGALIALRPYESLWQVLGEHFRGPRLQQLFGRYSTYCGSSPFQTPATLMLIAHVESQGVWLVDGGISALAEALATVARKNGAVFRYGETAQEIAIENNRAAGVRLASGEHIAAETVIANADPAAIAHGRFGETASHAVRKTPARSRSLSAFTWLAHARTSGFPLVRHNVFFSPDYRQEFRDINRGGLPSDPSVYICGQDRDASDAPCPEGRERLQIIVNAPANGDTHEYTQMEKDGCATHMMESLARCGLELERPLPHELATPNEFEALFPSTGGALYGQASHGWAASFLRQSARTRIPGLYCAGGSTHPGAGVPMAALSGRLAAETLMQDRASTASSRRRAMAGGMSTRSATTASSG